MLYFREDDSKAIGFFFAFWSFWSGRSPSLWETISNLQHTAAAACPAPLVSRIVPQCYDVIGWIFCIVQSEGCGKKRVPGIILQQSASTSIPKNLNTVQHNTRTHCSVVLWFSALVFGTHHHRVFAEYQYDIGKARLGSSWSGIAWWIH